MTQEERDLETLQERIKKALSGEFGDEEQEDMIVAIFEGELRHKIGMISVIGGNGVGSIGKQKDTLVF